MNDVEKVRLLLLSRLDYIPSPRISRVYEGAEPGPQASSYVPCEECSRPVEPRKNGCGRIRNRMPCLPCLEHLEARGRLMKRHTHGCSRCKRCDGRGERKRSRGEQEYDAYSGTTMIEAAALRADDLLKLSERRGRFQMDEGMDMSEDPVWRERGRYEAAGSYSDLDRALAALAECDQPRYSRLMYWAEHHGSPWWYWGPDAEEEVRETISALARVMPRPIRVPSWVRRAEQRAERQKEAA